MPPPASYSRRFLQLLFFTTIIALLLSSFLGDCVPITTNSQEQQQRQQQDFSNQFEFVTYEITQLKDEYTSTLQLRDTQVITTHDSFHVRPTRWFPTIFNGFPRGLQHQLDIGVRGLELDVMKGYKVMNFPGIDDVSTCDTFGVCVAQVIQWSQRHPRHYPITILIDADLSDAYPTFQTSTEWLEFSREIEKVFRANNASASLFIPRNLKPNERLLNVSLSRVFGKIMILIDCG
eukprot:PhF_6_TR14734/c0_g1_i1/m.23156